MSPLKDVITETESEKERETLMSVRKAECCKNCENTSADWIFRDAVLCSLINEYQSRTEVCDMFEMKEIEQ